MSKPNPPLSSVLPPLLLGTAAFNLQYNRNPLLLPTETIIETFLTSVPNPGFDTSPYYGPAELILGKALKSLTKKHAINREAYFISTKVGRIAAEEFDYSNSWIRRSIQRSLDRLGVPYVDLVYCHDVEFVTVEEVISAVRTLRNLKSEGKVRYIGISGYPVGLLAGLAETILRETGEPLDAVMSYGNYTVQNTRLQSKGLKRLKDAGVECVPNASPLGMGLLRQQGVPIGALGDFHPSSNELREACMRAVKFITEKGQGQKLEDVAYRWALESWADVGAVVGTSAISGTRKEGADDNDSDKIGATVIGVSYLDELKSILQLWKDVVQAREGDEGAVKRRKENDALASSLKHVFGQWYDDIWESPGEEYVRREPPKERFLSDEELWPEFLQ